MRYMLSAYSALLCCALLSTPFRAQAQTLPSVSSQIQPCEHPRFPEVATWLSRRPYDVLRYDLILDWRAALSDSSQALRKYRGVQTITLRCDTAQLWAIELDADSSLVVDSISIHRWHATSTERPTSQRTGDRLWLQLATPLHRGDTAAVTIAYRNNSASAMRRELYGGYNRYWHDDSGNELPSPIAYTMSQPNSARRWMPCNDRPYDKALATITILAPPGFTTLSNGTPDSVTLDWDDSQIRAYRYTSAEPISTYLMVAIASRYATLERSYRSRDSVRTIPLRLYLWQTDSISYADNAAWMLAVTEEMMRAYEQHYRPYPFGSYGQALLYPYFMGAMEHQTMTTHHRNALIQRWETVIAHELAHHWLGDLVTCATWNDLWLNEGGATYSERLWLEYAYGDSVARRYFAARRDRDYLRADGARSQPPVYNTSGTNLFNTGTTYVKAGWIFHMMRTMLGDSTFFGLLRSYFDRFAYQSLETEDLVRFCQERVPSPPVPWRTFFDQWVYAIGHPILHADLLALEQTARGYHIRVRIAQLQDSSAFLPVYVVPLQLRLREYWSGGAYDTTLLVSSREQFATLEVPFLPRTLELDPDDAILCQKDSSALVLSVEAETSPEDIRVLPHPCMRGQPLTVWLPPTWNAATIRLWRSDGRLAFQTTTSSELCSIESGSLAPGLYMLDVAAHGRRGRQRVIILP